MKRLAVLSVVLLLSACSSRDPVRELIDDVVDAAEDRDASALADLLADDFQGGDGSDKAAIVGTARQAFGAYRALDVSVEKLEVNRRGDSARATFRVKLTGTPREIGGLGDLVPRSAAYDFDVSARLNDGSWKIATASWAEVAP